MSRNTKIVIGIIAGILGACCLITIIAVVALRPMVQDAIENSADPTAAVEVAQSIVDYDLPPGYQEQGTMNLFLMQVAFLTGHNEQTFIMLAEFSDFFAGGEEEMQQQMQDAFANQVGSQNVNLSFVESEETTINGESATLATYEGTDEQGNEVRQIIGVFASKDGSPAMLMIFGYQDNWDEGGISRFLASLD